MHCHSGRAILDFTKCNNYVANNSIVCKFGTVMVISIPNIFHYMTSIGILTYLAIIANMDKTCLHLVVLKSNNSCENVSIVSAVGTLFVNDSSNIFCYSTCIEMLALFVH